MAVLVTAIHANMTHEIATKEAEIHAIHASSRLRPGVDARDKRGHNRFVNLPSEPRNPNHFDLPDSRIETA